MSREEGGAPYPTYVPSLSLSEIFSFPVDPSSSLEECYLGGMEADAFALKGSEDGRQSGSSS